MTDPDEPLACPSCAVRYAPDARFCSACKMPLVQVGAESLEAPRSEAHARARKINPIYADGDLVRVAGGRHQAEAELIQGMLLEEGVPSLLRRSAGFDVPDFLAAGPRDVLVPQAGAQAARDVLLEADMAPREAPPREGSDTAHAARLLAAILGGGLLTALVTWVLLELAG
ncbi:MAG: hypothetical protein ACR2GL_02835 [Thermoleophilaceae bacterium]